MEDKSEIAQIITAVKAANAEQITALLVLIFQG